ncbi:Spermidine/putrescine import ATP-binding protein PotA [Gimesia panareensis]|uniref:Spermidine/putrescine import ATP-binding protein PotA n=1 Tax=Gimesia panareensis TaxID=2527978 RepID=A0A518FWH2_9PLAN|nr:heme ABC exporter ATP-binding protein CcmA [Gimesia panareensis]QDV20586.1 Spermidine/putrescine import ATP-binding protein PotA [Gimesia panareensis]
MTESRSPCTLSPMPHAHDSTTDSFLLKIQNLDAGFGSFQVLQQVAIEVPAGETLVVLGESGCGKTTLLKVIAGLTPVSSGEILLGDQRLTDQAPGQRNVIYLDQEPLLFEHLTVAENIGFAMSLRNEPPAEIRSTVDEMLTAIDLKDHADKREHQLSGGQKQRVAFARAVLAQPQLLLLDEPFCSLDGKTRDQMQVLFHQLCRRYALTCLFVTHDVKEALITGDRFARMTAGAVTIYSDRNAFISDRSTGVMDEIRFWRETASGLE